MLLFVKSFSVMETPDCSTQVQAPRSTTPLQDEDMAKVPMVSLSTEKAVFRPQMVNDFWLDLLRWTSVPTGRQNGWISVPIGHQD